MGKSPKVLHYKGKNWAVSLDPRVSGLETPRTFLVFMPVSTGDIQALSFQGTREKTLSSILKSSKESQDKIPAPPPPGLLRTLQRIIRTPFSILCPQPPLNE